VLLAPVVDDEVHPRRRPLRVAAMAVVRSSELARLVSFVLLSLEIVQSVRRLLLSGSRKPA
jgi:hypothetical protein